MQPAPAPTTAGRAARRSVAARPDIRQAEQELVANAGIGIAKAGYFPRLSLTASLGSESKALSDGSAPAPAPGRSASAR